MAGIKHTTKLSCQPWTCTAEISLQENLLQWTQRTEGLNLQHLQSLCDAPAKAELPPDCSQPITRYNKTTVVGSFCPMWDPPYRQPWRGELPLAWPRHSQICTWVWGSVTQFSCLSSHFIGIRPSWKSWSLLNYAKSLPFIDIFPNKYLACLIPPWLLLVEGPELTH